MIGTALVIIFISCNFRQYLFYINKKQNETNCFPITIAMCCIFC